MVKRTVMCDRCGKDVETEHPDRITISRHYTDTYKDIFDKEHKRSVYRTSRSMHLCEECESKFNAFLEMDL